MMYFGEEVTERNESGKPREPDRATSVARYFSTDSKIIAARNKCSIELEL
jgi:hypothetical protein